MKSFLQGKRTLDIQSLRLPPAPVPTMTPTATHAHAHAPTTGTAPQVELVKQGDKIMRIIVTCNCGERTEIECLYPPGQ